MVMPGASIGASLSTKEALVIAAERLFARHGIDGVSIRQILQEAGVANNSAVQYHFESKAGLVRAIVDHRAPYLDERRRLLWAQAPAGEHDLGFDVGSGRETTLAPGLYFYRIQTSEGAAQGRFVVLRSHAR